MMAEPTADDGTLVCGILIHQDVIDDCLVNPVPLYVEELVTNIYAEAERRGRAIIQWRITFGPSMPTVHEQMCSDPEELAYLERWRVVKMTAHTIKRGAT